MIALLVFAYVAYAFALAVGWTELKWAWAPERRPRLFRRARRLGAEADVSGWERATLASSTRLLLVAALIASSMCIVIYPLGIVTVLAPFGFGSAWRLERRRVNRGDVWLTGALGTCGVLAVLPAAIPAAIFGDAGSGPWIPWLVAVVLLGAPALSFLAIARQYAVAGWFDRDARRRLAEDGLGDES